MTGPSGRCTVGTALIGALSCPAASFEDDHGNGSDPFVGDGQVMTAEATALEPGAQPGLELEGRFAERVPGHADGVERGRGTNAGAQRLAECFLRREALREKRGRTARRLEVRPFRRRQHPSREAVAEAVQRLLHAIELHDVHADACDHVPLPVDGWVASAAR